MISSLLLALSIAVPAQAAKTPPPAQTTPELSVLVERVVRLADLQRRKLDLEQELAAKHVGPEHPDAVEIRARLADLANEIQREGLQAYQSQASVLSGRRIALESELSRLRVGKSHPDFMRLSTQIAALKEQERVAAVALLSDNTETALKAAIARRPDSAQAYLDLAGLLITAGRVDEASALLVEALAALKRSGGR